MDTARKGLVLREWIIFALSFGFGGHVVLGLVLHDPGAWPVSKAGGYGVLIGLSIYVGVQVLRSLWWVIKDRYRVGDDPASS